MFRAVLDEHARQQAALATHRGAHHVHWPSSAPLEKHVTCHPPVTDLHLAAGQQHAGKSAAIIVQHLDSIVRQVSNKQQCMPTHGMVAALLWTYCSPEARSTVLPNT